MMRQTVRNTLYALVFLPFLVHCSGHLRDFSKGDPKSSVGDAGSKPQGDANGFQGVIKVAGVYFHLIEGAVPGVGRWYDKVFLIDHNGLAYLFFDFELAATPFAGQALSVGKREPIPSSDFVVASNQVIYQNDVYENPYTQTSLPAVLGQPDVFTNVSQADQFSRVYGITACNGRLFSTDWYYKRVLFWNSIPTISGKRPDGVLGWPDLSIRWQGAGNLNLGPVSASIFGQPQDVHCDGTRLLVADPDNHRVLIYNTLPTSNMAPADEVLGQTLFSTTSSGTTATTLNAPTAAFSDQYHIIVSDTGNNRVLIWNDEVNASDFDLGAAIVLGQPDMLSGTANYEGISAKGLSSPRKVWSDGTRLAVVDEGNHRVLIWNTFPTANGQPADLVLGQPDMTSNSPNNGGRAAISLHTPHAFHFDGVRFYVSEPLGNTNSRILVWNSFPTVNRQPADLMLGGTDFTNWGCYHTGVNGPYDPNCVDMTYSMTSTSNKLIVGRHFNWFGDIKIFPKPMASNPDAEVRLGKSSMTNRTNVVQPDISAQSQYSVTSIAMTKTHLFVVDGGWNRVQVWSPLPTATNQAANLVLGQDDFVSSIWETTSNRSTQGMAGGYSQNLFTDGIRLFLVNANRVMIWNSIPTTNHQSANVVLGQADFSTNAENTAGSPTATTLRRPRNGWSDGTRMVLADTGNNRVLIWNSIPTADGQAADVVVGQADMTTAATGAATASNLNAPSDAIIVGTKLLVADYSNHRVLVWNTIPTTFGQPADLVIGQTVMSGSGWGTNLSRMYAPSGLYSDGTKLYVTEYGNNRVIVYNTIPTSSGVAANYKVFNSTPSNFTLDNTTVSGPSSRVHIENGGLWIPDWLNNRILVRKLSEIVP